jgi:N,N'-diacetyllegionaminate synthase
MTDRRFFIGDRAIGDDAACFIIAEIGLAHDGSLGAAHAFIDAAAATGVDAVKFQTHIAEEESSDRESFRVKIFPQDDTRFDYWVRTSFTEDQWRGLKQHAEQKGLVFLSSPFSIAAVSLLNRIGIKAWKIGSGETNNLLMLEEISSLRQPVFLSSGMSYPDELDLSTNLLLSRSVPLLVMQCTSSYPCPPEEFGLNLIGEFKRRYGVSVGYSDHSGEIAACIAAVTLGAAAVEVHVTWSKQCFGPDVPASLTFDQLAELVRGIRVVEHALKNDVDKAALAEKMKPMRHLFMKGLVARDDVAAGTRLQRAHLDSRKPCTGISVAEYTSVIGKLLTRSLRRGDPIQWRDLE